MGFAVGNSSQLNARTCAHVYRTAAPERPDVRLLSRCSARKPFLCNRSTCGGRTVRQARAAARGNTVVCRAEGGKLTFAVTGATGLVGARLVSKLVSFGHTVRVLTRDERKASKKLPYPRIKFFKPQRWEEGIRGADAVINLAGEPISTRWTTAVKQEIKRSRVETTRKLVDIINALPEEERPQVLVSTSAVGYYGTSRSETFKESSNPGSDYLAEVCKAWEAEAEKAKTGRVVILRVGIVLAKEGGAIGKMLPVFSLFAGGPLGSGEQWCSWIHRDDLVRMYIETATNPSFIGTYNATAPAPVRMSELCSSLGSTLGRPSWLPVPDFAVQALLGEGAGVVLEGQKVLPKRAEDTGYAFLFPDVASAVRNILR